jgi:hypothetical protein
MRKPKAIFNYCSHPTVAADEIPETVKTIISVILSLNEHL